MTEPAPKPRNPMRVAIGGLAVAVAVMAAMVILTKARGGNSTARISSDPWTLEDSERAVWQFH